MLTKNKVILLVGAFLSILAVTVFSGEMGKDLVQTFTSRGSETEKNETSELDEDDQDRSSGSEEDAEDAPPQRPEESSSTPTEPPMSFPIHLSNLDPIDGDLRLYGTAGTPQDNFGNNYEADIYRRDDSWEDHVTYYINGDYSKLSLEAALCRDSMQCGNSGVWLVIYGDNNIELGRTKMFRASEIPLPETLEVSVQDNETLTFVVMADEGGGPLQNGASMVVRNVTLYP